MFWSILFSFIIPSAQFKICNPVFGSTLFLNVVVALYLGMGIPKYSDNSPFVLLAISIFLTFKGVTLKLLQNGCLPIVKDGSTK